MQILSHRIWIFVEGERERRGAIMQSIKSNVLFKIRKTIEQVTKYHRSNDQTHTNTLDELFTIVERLD